MEFNKALVYTAVNADELKPGDMVIVADNVADLRDMVMKDTEPKEVREITTEYNAYRFKVKGNICNFALAFLVERAENCTNCVHRECEVCKKMLDGVVR